MVAFAGIWAWIIAHKIALALVVSEVLALLPEGWVKSGGIVDMGWKIIKKLLGIESAGASISQIK